MAPRSLPLTRSAGIRRACAGACLVALLAGCGGGGATTSPGGETGGLYGTVTRGPTRPVCQDGIPCSEPASGATLVFSLGSQAAATVVTAKDGTYSVSLPTGTYGVTVTPQPPTGHAINAIVHVTAGTTRKADFQIDTGIR